MRKKVTIVGSGNVGATAAHWIASKELADVALITTAEDDDAEETAFSQPANARQPGDCARRDTFRGDRTRRGCGSQREWR